MIECGKLNRYIEALLTKSEEAYLLALEIINKPTINYRTEGFCLFIYNAWELLLKAYQRCVTNFNIFFKKHFPDYKLNEKITLFIALTNPGNLEKSPLILNPTNLLLYEKLINFKRLMIMFFSIYKANEYN